MILNIWQSKQRSCMENKACKNEYSALTFAFSSIFDFEKLTLSEQDVKDTGRGQCKRAQFNSIDEVLLFLTAQSSLVDIW